jgi:predicted DsbA family dithiol-disulfide isomerase
MTEPRVIEVFSDYVCPWCYLGSARVARLQKEHGVQVKFVHFPLHPETPPEGKSLEALFAGRDYKVETTDDYKSARVVLLDPEVFK